MRNEGSSDHSWNNMGNDILVKIFMTLNVMDLITSVSQVCSSWRSACCEPILWKKLDLRMLKPSFVCNPPKPYPWSNRLSTTILMSVLKRSLNLSRGNVTFLIFNFFECIRDEHLVCVAKRTRNLKRLILPATWHQITIGGAEEAFKIRMEHMEVIGTYCKNLFELKIDCQFDLELACTLTRHFRKLKVVSLRCKTVHNEALIHILYKLENLEVLNISHCLFIQFEKGSETSFTLYHEPFLTCQTKPCDTCKSAPSVEGVSRSTWYELEQRYWGEDEVSSLAH
ncbi:hypothetical protein RGQ29_007201 [Quercus rubra]|uniref:F-box domain-containing protein n=1 Tax=Quercus rubra TaxID=3512 RepID=A0AAN7DWP8_QUERU|nr:hypothetical protein RGQ29_007201 [Quercus rubra]